MAIAIFNVNDHEQHCRAHLQHLVNKDNLYETSTICYTPCATQFANYGAVLALKTQKRL